MSSNLIRIVFTALLAVGFAGAAQAYEYQSASLTFDDCDAMGCEGSTLSLSVTEVDGSDGIEGGSWEVVYTINTEFYDYDSSLLGGFNQIGFKAVADWTSGEITDVPEGSIAIDQTGYGPNPWEPVFEAPINSQSLCDNTNGNSSKVCIAGFVDITKELSDGTYNYTWEFLLEGGRLLDVEDWHLGAQYAGGPWRSAGHIISAQVPEPTAAVLFGLGAMLVTRRVRRH